VSFVKALAQSALITLLYLAVFDVVGVLASLIFDVLPLRAVSTALFYAIWFVLGVFCGVLSYSSAVSGRAAWLVIATTALVLVALTWACTALLWQASIEASHFVPDNVPLTLVFFGATFGGTIIGHLALRPDPKPGG
jgi:hypothetical protein